MTDTDLSGRELDEALALATGPDKHPEYWWWEQTMPEWPKDAPALYCGPEYHTSIDDTLRDHWEELQRRGWVTYRIGPITATIYRPYKEAKGWDDTSATAFARAVLAAYREGK